MTPDTGTLTTVLEQILSMLKLGKAGVGSDAYSLLTILATIEILIGALWWAITGQDALVGLLKKLLFIGFFLFVISNYDSLLHTVIDGFIHTGKIAGSGSGDSLASIKNPSSIVEAGFTATKPVFEHLTTFATWDVISHLADIIISLICALGILIAHFIIAIQVFVTYLEFGLISTLGLILIPFGVLRHTSFLAEKVFGAIISFGIKLMVLGLLVSITVPLLKGYAVPPDPSWTHLFNMLVLSFAMAALAWHAPGVAAGMMSGGPSLTAGTAAGTTLAGGAAALAAGFTPAIASNVASRGLSIGGAAARATATGAGTIVGGASTARQLAASSGAGSTLQYGAAGIGATVGPLAATVNAVGKAGLSATRPLADAFASGRSDVPWYSRLEAKRLVTEGAATSTTPSTATSQPKTKDERSKPSSEKTPSGQTTSLKDQLVKVGHLSKESVPHTAQPQGGTVVPIRHEDKGER